MIRNRLAGQPFLLGATRGRALVPGRLQMAADLCYNFVADTLRNAAGPDGMVFFPLVFSLFMFMRSANLSPISVSHRRGAVQGIASQAHCCSIAQSRQILSVNGNPTAAADLCAEFAQRAHHLLAAAPKLRAMPPAWLTADARTASIDRLSPLSLEGTGHGSLEDVLPDAPEQQPVSNNGRSEH
jgi:hypothetical protein